MQNMSQVRNREHVFLLKEDEPPSKKLFSNADVFIKKLAEKQCNTSINLQEELSKSKEFTKATELVPLARYHPGTSSLSKFQETAKHFDHIEKLKTSGLSDKEIELFFDNLKGEDYLLSKHKNWEISLLKQYLREIYEKIQKYENSQNLLDTAAGKLPKNEISENSLSIKPNSLQTKLLKFALNNEKDSIKSDLPHPIDSIKQIEKTYFEHLNESPLPPLNKIRRKARKLANRIEKSSDVVVSISKTIEGKNIDHKNYLIRNSKWDVTEALPSNDEIKEKKIYTCLSQNYYTVRNGKIIKLNNEEISKRGLQVTKKLSVEEIRKISKFKNYKKGTPSKVLYLKNLSSCIKEENLQDMLKHYKKHGSITYKIMTGRMKGQAFITLPNENVADQVLEEINGTVIGNKPIIVQYGNRQI